MEKIRVLIADDHTMFRHTLRKSLGTKRQFQVVAEAANGREVFEKCQENHPDVILMDLQMPNQDGIETTKELREAYPDVGIIALTMHDDDDHLFGALRAGVNAYILKTSSLEELIEHITEIAAGRSMFKSVMAKRVMEEFARLSQPAQCRDKNKLTSRESEVLQLLARGRAPKEIARILFVSEKTVRNHVTNIYAKLECHDRTQAVLKGQRLGIIKTEH
jgi:two-component system response regulator DegU